MSGHFWQIEVLGNGLGTWMVALAIFLVTFTVLPIAKRLIAAQRRRLTERAPLQMNYAIDLAALLAEHTNRLFLWGVALWLASRGLTFPPRVERWLTVLLVLLLWMQMAQWAMTAVRYAIEVRGRRSTGPDTLLKSSLQVIMFAAGLIIWGLALAGRQLLPRFYGKTPVPFLCP